MGDWYYGNDGRWHHDPAAPSPGQQPAVTMIRPATPPVAHPGSEAPEHPGGDWANADAYASYDDVDSTTIDDPGAP